MTDQAIVLVQPEIRWRDVFNINFPNDNLRQRVTRFLDLFEQAAFRYDVMDPQTQAIETRYLQGQDILREVVKRREEVRRLMAAAKGTDKWTDIDKRFSQQDIIKTGKYTISQHDRAYDGVDQNECFTRQATVLDKWRFPLFISIGSDYLKGAKYTGEDGKLHPVSVDGVLVHEIAHLAYATEKEETPVMVESIVIAAMGAVQRIPGEKVIFSKGSNGGFQSLAHKINLQDLRSMFSVPASGADTRRAEQIAEAQPASTGVVPEFKIG